MAQNDIHDDKPRSRAKTWDIGATRRRAGFMQPAGLADTSGWLGRLLSQWALAEVAPGRLLPWLPVAFGFGIVGYFTADREPAVWAASALALAGVAVAILARRHAVGFMLALGFAAIAAGFAVATLRTARIAHPILQVPASSVTLAGFVEIREERERSDRIVVRVQRFEGRRNGDTPDRVRVAVRNGTAPEAGSFVEFKAHLSPPLPPLRPGGYDFARDMYFNRLARPAMRSSLSSPHRRRSRPVSGCAICHFSIQCARRSTRASAPPSPAMKAPSRRR